MAAIERTPLFMARRFLDHHIMNLLIRLGTPAPEDPSQVAVFFTTLARPVPGQPNFLEMMTLRQIRHTYLELEGMSMALIEVNASRSVVEQRTFDALEERLRVLSLESTPADQEVAHRIDHQLDEIQERGRTNIAAFREEKRRVYVFKNIIRNRVLQLGAEGRHPELAEMQAILGMINNEVMPGYSVVDASQRWGAAAAQIEVEVEVEVEVEEGFEVAGTKHFCANCQIPSKAEGCRLKKCGGCMRVRYCSADCQNAQWQEHKAFCASVSRSVE